ncbi:MAG: hypothetical protein QF898_04305 [SAR202 cluster bacterium]|nr:hypothetical protein [SAR202 cluster bacterium]
MPPPDRPKRGHDPWLLDVWSYHRRVYERSRSDAAMTTWFFQLMWFALIFPFRFLLGAWRKRRRAAQWRRFVYGPPEDDASAEK